MAIATVSYKAEIKDLRAKLESITDITSAQAKKMVRDLNQSMRAVEKANRRASKSMQVTAQSTSAAAVSARNLAVQMPDVVTQLASGTSAMQVFTQQGLQVLQVEAATGTGLISKLGLTMASLGPIVLAAAAVAAPFAAAYAVVAHQLKETEAATAAVAKVAGQLGNAHSKLQSVTTGVDETFRKTIGTYDAIAVAQERRDKDIRRSAAAERRAAAALLEAAETRRRSADTIEEVRAADQALAMARQQHTRILSGVNRAEREALQQSQQIVDYQREREESERVLAERAEQRARSEQSRAKREAELLRLERERAAAAKQLAQIQQAASLSVLSGEERVTEELRRQLERVNELERTSQDAAAASAARQALAIEYEHRIGEIRRREAERTAKEQQRQAAETERARQQAMQQSMQMATEAANLLQFGFGRSYEIMQSDVTRLQTVQAEAGEHMTAAQQKQLSKRIEAQKRAARNAFEAQQAAAAAEAAVNTALAISKAATAAPPPFNIALMGIAGAQGLAQQRAIARQRPSFHTGGAVDLAPDETTATVRNGEFMLSPTGRRAYSDAELHRANAGQGGGGRDVVAVSVYKHTTQVDRWKRDGLQAGDPIQRAIGKGRLVGHRSNRG